MVSTLGLNYCRCEHPLIRCDNHGCRCITCGGLDVPMFVRRKEAGLTLPVLPDWMSRSYPYMSIAQHFGVDYGLVLRHSRVDVIALHEIPGEGNLTRDREYVAAIRAARALWDYVRHPARPETTIQATVDALRPILF